MENKNVFTIPVSGLALGNHSYRFEVDDDFFADRDYSEVRQGHVIVKTDVERSETMLSLNFDLKGSVRVVCDRCDEMFDLPIADKQEFFLKLGTETKEEAENVIVLPVTQREFDLSDLVYEFIILALPMQRVHPEGQCNGEMLEYLSEHEAFVEEDDVEESDPRWEALKNFNVEDN